MMPLETCIFELWKSFFLVLCFVLTWKLFVWMQQNMHEKLKKRTFFTTLFCSHARLFFANCHSCLTTYFHISKVWQVYAHNLLMSISKHSEEKLSLLVHFYWEMVNKSLRTSHTQCLKIAQKSLIWSFVVNK